MKMVVTFKNSGKAVNQIEKANKLLDELQKVISSDLNESLEVEIGNLKGNRTNGTCMIIEFKNPNEAILKIQEAKELLKKLRDIVCWELKSTMTVELSNKKSKSSASTKDLTND